MKITYTSNPLDSIIELDEHEQKELWYKLKVEEMVNMLFSVHYEMTSKKDGPDMERIKREVEPDYYSNEDNEKSLIDKRCDELLQYCLEELKGSHVGDCTCVAMPCSKCHTESILGINTIQGLGKYEGHKISSLFNYYENDVWKTREFDDVLKMLEEYDPTPTGPGWDKLGGHERYVPRWKAEAKRAHKWLLNYRDTKLQDT